MVTEQEFKRAIRGKRIYVTVAGTETDVQTSRQDALFLFKRVGGDIGWFVNEKDISLEANSTQMFGKTGEIA